MRNFYKTAMDSLEKSREEMTAGGNFSLDS
jgi:hypothetical protein